MEGNSRSRFGSKFWSPETHILSHNMNRAGSFLLQNRIESWDVLVYKDYSSEYSSEDNRTWEEVKCHNYTLLSQYLHTKWNCCFWLNLKVIASFFFSWSCEKCIMHFPWNKIFIVIARTKELLYFCLWKLFK